MQQKEMMDKPAGQNRQEQQYRADGKLSKALADEPGYVGQQRNEQGKNNPRTDIVSFKHR